MSCALGLVSDFAREVQILTNFWNLLNGFCQI